MERTKTSLVRIICQFTWREVQTCPTRNDRGSRRDLHQQLEGVRYQPLIMFWVAQATTRSHL